MPGLPPELRRFHLELAREPGHPEGCRRTGYDIVAPLDQESGPAAEFWREHRDDCRVRRFTEGQDDALGRLALRPDGSWVIDFDPACESEDQQGFRLGEERLVPGEHVGRGCEHGSTRTHRVVSVEKV